MSPEQFVVWLREFIMDGSAPGHDGLPIAVPMDARELRIINEQLSRVVIKTQPAQPGVPGILGQGLARLEKAEDVAWASADPTEVRVFNGGGCQ